MYSYVVVAIVSSYSYRKYIVNIMIVLVLVLVATILVEVFCLVRMSDSY